MSEMKPKYGNKKVVCEYGVFDSHAEWHDYLGLLARQQADEISNLRRQVQYVLLDGFRDNEGTWQRAITYTVDFDFIEGGVHIALDTKGVMTQAGRLREKLFRQRYPGIKLVINYTGRDMRREGK